MKITKLVFGLAFLGMFACSAKHTTDKSVQPHVDITPPEAPDGLTADVLSSNSVKLTWNDNSSDEHYFAIYRRGGNEADTFAFSQRLLFNTTTCLETDLLDSATYSFYVLALKSDVSSTPSNVATVTTMVRGLSLAGICRIQTGGGAALDMFGSYAYLALRNGRVCPVDITNPTEPHLLTPYQAPGEIRSIYHFLSVYLTMGQRGVQVLNYADPEHPTVLGSIDTPGNATGLCMVVDALDSTYYYVVDGSSLQIIDNNTHPHIVGEFRSPSIPIIYDAAADLFNAYLACGDSGLQILDTTNPRSPNLRGHLNIPGSVRKVALGSASMFNTYVYVLGTSPNLYIVNVSDPANPIIAATFNIGDSQHAIFIAEYLAYISYLDGLKILNITNPAAPSYAAFYPTHDDISGIRAYNNYIYLLDNGGLKILEYLP
jgi:hypothetical protein